MAWFKKTRKPIASSTAEKPSRVPEGLWVKCPGCAQLIYNKDLETNLNVCPKCAHHFRISAAERLKALFDDGDYDGALPQPRLQRSAAVHRHQALSRSPADDHRSAPASRTR